MSQFVRGTKVHDSFAGCYVALGHKPCIRFAVHDALYLVAGHLGHHHGHTSLGRIGQYHLGFGRPIRSQNQVAGIIALLGIAQLINRLLQVGSILIMVTQIQFHLSGQGSLSFGQVFNHHIDGWLP